MFSRKNHLIIISMGLLIAALGYVFSVQAADNMMMARSQTATVSSPSKAKVGTCKRKVNDNCMGCHEKEGWFDMKFVHGPLGMNLCSPCHETKDNKLTHKFKQKPKELCYYCHEEARIVDEHLSKLSVKTTKCLYCHNPHASEKEFFLR